jgi:hypothetical protein
MQIDNRFDVSIEWIQRLDGQGGQYVVRPVRNNCCFTTPAQASVAARATKQAIQAELRAKLASIKNKTVGAGSKFSALISSKGKETEQQRQDAINKLKTFITRIDNAHATAPDASVDREFLAEIFSERDIDDVTEQARPANERTRLIHSERQHASASVASVIQDHSDEIQKSEVQEIVTLINRVKTEYKSKSLNTAKIAIERQDPGVYRRKAFQQLLKDRNISLSKGARELIHAIQQPKAGQAKHNWIDASLEDETPMTLDKALNHVILQFEQ